MIYKTENPNVNMTRNTIRLIIGKAGILFVILSAFYSDMLAQELSLENYQLIQREKLKSIIGGYHNFSSGERMAFKNYIGQEWVTNYVYMGEVYLDKTKPEILPSKIISYNTSAILQKILIKGNYGYKRTFEKEFELLKIPKDSTLYEDTITLNYCNSLSYYYIPKEIKRIRLPDISEKRLAATYYRINPVHINHIMHQLLMDKKRYNVNDWGFIELIRKLSEEIFKNRNEQLFFSWLILMKSGYDIKLTRANKKNLIIFYAVLQEVFETEYMIINNKRYYCLHGESPASVMTYIEDFNYTTYPVDLSIQSIPNLDENLEKRMYEFSYKRKKHVIALHLDNALNEYYKNYPNCDLNIYFNSPVSETLKDELYRELHPIMKNMTAVQKVNFLLFFVQNVSEYKTDFEQFYKEKYLFPDEFLFHDYSDSDDRSIFFSTLISIFLDAPIIGLKFKNHIATAVSIEKARGKSINFSGMVYYIADPTYKNTTIGIPEQD